MWRMRSGIPRRRSGRTGVRSSSIWRTSRCRTVQRQHAFCPFCCPVFPRILHNLRLAVSDTPPGAEQARGYLKTGDVTGSAKRPAARGHWLFSDTPQQRILHDFYAIVAPYLYNFHHKSLKLSFFLFLFILFAEERSSSSHPASESGGLSLLRQNARDILNKERRF